LHSVQPITTTLPARLLADEAATNALAAELAPWLTPGMVVYLEGDLGAGKTALARGLLRSMGHDGPVKSPTYSLVEVYVISSLYWYHFDFYRFSYPEEFDDAGLGEYFRSDAVCLVEWPDKAAPCVPPADLVVTLRCEGEGRRIALSARSPAGETCLRALSPRLAPFPIAPDATS